MSGERFRFGLFEFEPQTGELVRDGQAVRLQAQPGRVLASLLSRAGTLVSREELQRDVWGSDTHVDFERGLNFCIAQIRTALRDNAETPRYVATVPKQGYRFIAPVTRIAPGAARSAAVEPAADATRPTSRRSSRSFIPRAAIALILMAVAIFVGWRFAGGRSGPPAVVVIPFYNETGRLEHDALAKAIGDATVARLAAGERLSALSVIGNAPSLAHPFAREDVQRVAKELDARWLVIGQLKTDGRQMRVIGHLIRVEDMKHVWAQNFDDPAFELPAQERTAEAIASAVSHALASH